METIERRFLQWARQVCIPIALQAPELGRLDLNAFDGVIGEAPLVALSEAFHGAAEVLELRNRLLHYLVKQKGFTAIAIESGIVESRVVHQYVRGGPGDLDQILKQGISWTFDELPQNRSLIRWLREYNANPQSGRKISFYGFDVPGSPGNPEAKRGPRTALCETLKYLATVDDGAAREFRARLATTWAMIRFDSTNNSGYPMLSHADRDGITATIADLISLMERREAPYRAASSDSDYEWAYRASLGARQLDAWLRSVPRQAEALGPHAQFFSAATDIRDRAQADNLEWIVEREGPKGKILIFASRYHVSKAPVWTTWWSSSEQGPLPQQVAGTYWHRRFGNQLVTIGNSVGGGCIGCGHFEVTLTAPLPGSFEELAGQIDEPCYVLDLRTAPAEIADYLDHEHPLGPHGQALSLNVRRAFDVVLYVANVTPAASGGNDHANA